MGKDSNMNSRNDGLAYPITRRAVVLGAAGLAFASAFPAVARGNLTPENPTSSDGLAHPIPYANPPGIGKVRGLVLGGGGTYMMSWLLGYFHALKQEGVNVNDADIVVGTSAGSMAGALLTAGAIDGYTTEMEFLTEFPKLVAKLSVRPTLNDSQERAQQLVFNAKNADPRSIQAIGRAAMAANNPKGPAEFPNMIRDIIGEAKWPSDRLYTTANDCYSGERLVVSANDNISINTACAASSALPGGMGPVWLKNRLAMDGGICQTSTHSDVVGGVKKALIFSVSDGSQKAAKNGLRVSNLPNILQEEILRLNQNGTRTELIVCGLIPGLAHVDSLVSAEWIAPLMKYGREQGLANATRIRNFWNS